MATLANDTFTRTASSSWGSANTGGAWTLTGTATDFAVNGSAGTISTAKGITRKAFLTAVSSDNADVTVSFSIPVVPAGGSAMIYLIGRGTATDWHGVKATISTAGVMQLIAVRSVAGTETVLGSTATVPGTFTAGAVWKIRVQVSGTGTTTINGRLWTGTEPGTWAVSQTDTVGPQVAGGIGITTYAGSAVTNGPFVYSIDDLTAVTLVNSVTVAAVVATASAAARTPVVSGAATVAAPASAATAAVAAPAVSGGSGVTATVATASAAAVAPAVSGSSGSPSTGLLWRNEWTGQAEGQDVTIGNSSASGSAISGVTATAPVYGAAAASDGGMGLLIAASSVASTITASITARASTVIEVDHLVTAGTITTHSLLKGSTSAAARAFEIRYSSGRQVRVWDSATTQLFASTATLTAAWHRFTITLDHAAGRMRLLVTRLSDMVRVIDWTSAAGQAFGADLATVVAGKYDTVACPDIYLDRLYLRSVPSWWGPASPINAPITASPALDAQSSAIATALAAGSQVLDVIEYGVPIYHASADTPRWTITPANTGAWGANPFQGRTVPLSMSWNPQAVAADGALAVLDTDGVTAYGFYNLDLSGAAPVCDWGEVYRIDQDALTTVAGKSTGSGIPRGAGIVTTEDWSRGIISHALVISTDIARPTTYRYPATSTDGANLRGSSTTIVEGTRLQLDPTINVAALGLPTYAAMVAVALQTYGAYVIDNGGASIAVIAERPPGVVPPSTVNSAAEASVGITGDYRSLAGIPWTSVRTLAAWDGSGDGSATVDATVASASMSAIAPVVSAVVIIPSGGPATATAMAPAPTVSAGSAATVLAQAAAASVAAMPPTISAGTVVLAVVASATAAGWAPTIATGSTITAPTATATASALSPTVAAGSAVQVLASVATASAAALPPAITAGSAIAPPTATATASAAAPTVAAGSAGQVLAPAATASAAARPPTITTGTTVLAAVATASAAALAPAIAGGASGQVLATPATASAAALPPTVTTGAAVAALAATGTWSALAPVVTAAAAGHVIAPVAAMSAAALPPAVSTSAWVTASVATSVMAGQAPTVTGGASVVASSSSAIAAALPPAVSAAAAGVVTAVVAPAYAVCPTPAVSGGSVVAAPAAAALWSAGTATPQGAAVVTPPPATAICAAWPATAAADRPGTIPPEARTLTIDAEARTLTIPAEDRTLTVQPSLVLA